MIKLFIDTTKNHFIDIALKNGEVLLLEKSFEAKYSQAEKLLPEIEKLILESGKELRDLSEIEVVNKSNDECTSFSALRIGIITANALGYALGIRVLGSDYVIENDKNEFNFIKPVYNKKPNIT